MRTGEASDKGPLLRPLHPVFAAVLAVCIIFDVLDLWGRVHYPDALAADACAMWPYIKFAGAAISNELSDHVRRTCGASEAEPVTSIIFFVAKIAVALIAALFAWGVILTTRGMAHRLKLHAFRLIEARGYSDALKQTITGAIIGCIFIAVGIVHCGHLEAPATYGISLLHKLVEDAVSFSTSFLLWGLTSLVIWYALYPFQRRELAKRD